MKAIQNKITSIITNNGVSMTGAALAVMATGIMLLTVNTLFS